MCKTTTTGPLLVKGAKEESALPQPSSVARYSCAASMIAVFVAWCSVVFVEEDKAPGIGSPLHDYKTPLFLTGGYLLGLPLLRTFTSLFLSDIVDVKVLLKETMIIYNGGQVLLNGWMVYKIMDAVLYRGHPFFGDVQTISGASFAVWVHYMDKYLEFFDTIFMVLRGRMDQVSFLHVYHHVSIAWAWWFAVKSWPGGDSYFGALLNSFIHVMMYSYYTLSLLKVRCPWKKYLTQAQLIQFTTVLIYTACMSVYHIKYSELESKHYWCMAIQSFEMTSLFFLFMAFYSKAYKKKKNAITTKKQI
eukprot:scaffold1482_cov120-Cylindrotheca_fusiformis.AAC.4